MKISLLGRTVELVGSTTQPDFVWIRDDPKLPEKVAIGLLETDGGLDAIQAEIRRLEPNVVFPPGWFEL